MDKIDDQDKSIEDKHHVCRNTPSCPSGAPMPQPQPRVNVMANAMQELERMESRRGSITQWDERLVAKAINAIDESAEGQTAKHAMWAFWKRDYAAYDAAAESILAMNSVSDLPSVFTNFAFFSSYALNPRLGALFNHRSFEAGHSDPKLLPHTFEHAWITADIELCNIALEQMDKFKLSVKDNDRNILSTANRLLEKAGVSFEEYHEYIDAVSQLVRGYLDGRTDVLFRTLLSVDEHEDGHEEILYEIDLNLDDETLDRLDEELLSLQSDPERVSPALNKYVGVLVRDYPEEAGAEAC